MIHLRRWGLVAGLVILSGCASDSGCGCGHGLFGRLMGRSRQAECCPVMEDPCCDGMMGAPMVGGESYESFAPPIGVAPPPPPPPPAAIQPSSPMAKPMPYTPNGR